MSTSTLTVCTDECKLLCGNESFIVSSVLFVCFSELQYNHYKVASSKKLLNPCWHNRLCAFTVRQM